MNDRFDCATGQSLADELLGVGTTWAPGARAARLLDGQRLPWTTLRGATRAVTTIRSVRTGAVPATADAAVRRAEPGTPTDTFGAGRQLHRPAR